MTTKKEKPKFVVENDWQPTKVYEVDEYLKELVRVTKTLQSGQSIPLSVAELQKRYNWKTASSCTNAIRHLFKKQVSEAFYAKLTFHEVKQSNGKVEFIRVRHK